MNILLTGSGGFIGKNLKKYLEKDFRLLTPRSYELDLSNSDDVKKYFDDNKIDFIIHCASIGGERDKADKKNTLETNLLMVKNLISAKKKDVRIILFGSGAMYDKSRILHRVKESEIGKYIPNDLYGKSKMKIAKLIAKRKDVLCLNIFACYGYDEKPSRFPSYAINQILKNKPIEINQNVCFDYLFVEDMQKIVEYFIYSWPKDSIINITPNYSITLQEIAEIVNQFGENKVAIINKSSKMGNEYSGDNSLLRKNYPSLNFTTPEKGLLKLFEHIKENLTQEILI